jgi:ketosteroid isomerase-like protein
MSKENVDGYHQAIDAFNRRDRAAWLALCDRELENIPPQDWPESQPIKGREAVWDFFVEGFEPWEESRLESFELIDAGNDKIVAELRTKVRGKASGATVAWSFWQVVTVRNGKALRFEWFTHRADALEAAGLRE